MSFIDVLATLLALLLGIVIYYKRAFNYLKKRGVPHLLPPTIPFGNMPNPFPPKIYIGNHIKTAYDAGKRQGYKHGAFFWCSKPKYIPIDLGYIKNILQKDFSYFTERGFYHNEEKDPLSANLFALGGEEWRYLRAKLSPAFTSGKLKMMFDSLLECAYQMGEYCENKQVVDIKDVSECFSIDVIGSCAFGLDCNCFKNPDAEFKKQGRKIFHFDQLRVAKVVLAFTYPKIAKFLGIRLIEEDSTDFFVNLVKDTLKYRENNNVVRKDFLQLLFELRNETENGTEDSQRFTLVELTAQVVVFFGAGFETSSITFTFCLYELARNPEIQEKLREEIEEVLKCNDGKITYESIAEMKYMNQVVEETLRIYPPVSFVTRECGRDYQIPGTDTVIEKGTEVFVTILGIHHDPDYYMDPEKFDPDRFSEENKKRRTPYTYMPFGEGPRICIGLRFGLMQIKVGLTVLLKNYRFALNKRTTVPPQIEPCSFTLTPREGIFLEVEKVKVISK